LGNIEAMNYNHNHEHENWHLLCQIIPKYKTTTFTSSKFVKYNFKVWTYHCQNVYIMW
jgi:hypothetical protein